MKKNLICLIILVVLLVLSGCASTETENTNIGNEYIDIENQNNYMENNDTNNSSILFNSSEVVLDYNDAISFENALNSGEKVNGKSVKFKVNNYKPDSAMGINCWAGEHLNFISDNELDAKAEDIIIGRVREEPTKFLGSWIIKYDVIQINDRQQENKIEENILIENVENNNNIENESIENTETDNTNIIDKFENNEEENKVTYNYYTTNSNEMAKKGNTGKYSYVKRNDSYKVYWIVDFDNGYVYNFTEGNGDDSCEKIKIKSGNLNDGLELSYKTLNNAWVKYLHFKYTNQPHQLVIVDNDYFEYNYSTTSLEEALKLMENKIIWEP